MSAVLKCVLCSKEYSLNAERYRCDCSGLLDVVQDLKKLKENVSIELFDSRLGCGDFPFNSGVWRFKELLFPIENKFIVSKPEGNTNLYDSKFVAEYAGVSRMLLKHEGENPTGSFKDRGMTVGVSAAKMLGKKNVACASTGNTSASMASYASNAEMNGIVFIPDGKIAFGKLSQALAYGAKTFQIKGNFDDAMKLVTQASSELNLYLLNSINPFRLEGQKTIVFEMLQQLNWNVPDWIVVPGGNLGNSSSFGKALMELKELGLIKKVPRIAIIQAKGANPFYQSFKGKFRKKIEVEHPETIATAIKIGKPVSYDKAKRAIEFTNGVVEELSEEEIMDAKAIIDRAGIGCEPASACSLGGTKKLKEKGIIKKDDLVVGILTGNLLKDPNATIDYHTKSKKAKFANAPIKIPAKIDAVKKFL